MTNFTKHHPLLKIIRGALIDLPSPRRLSRLWNFGSLLGLCLAIQLVSGLFLAIHYSGDVGLAFERVRHMSRDVNLGWILRILHANGASVFFMCLYVHTARGIYYASYRLHLTWVAGLVLLLLVMAAAFIGYVLPWGQISFWGATVITNLFSAIPLIGPDVVSWIWGGFSVDNATLTRFFTFHFLIPFIVTSMAGVHLLFLHQTGSNSPIGAPLNRDKVPFHPYYSSKDAFGFLVLILALGLLVFRAPWALGDPENFIPANPLVTPTHIQPEWYFLFAYAILRSIPNKLGGVIALAGAVLILGVLPLAPHSSMRGSRHYYFNKLIFWYLVVVVALLTWIGARPVEEPFVACGQILTVLYFSFFLTYGPVAKIWDSIAR